MKVGSVNTVVGKYMNQQNVRVKSSSSTKVERDAVELSLEAKTFTEAYSRVKQSMNIASNDARVTELMESVRDGSYSVESLDICASILV